MSYKIKCPNCGQERRYNPHKEITKESQAKCFACNKTFKVADYIVEVE